MAKEYRNVVEADEKRIILDFGNFNLIPPSQSLTDEPTRYYVANVKWAKLIEGFVDQLARTTPWRDAEDESYTGIQTILEFLEGVEVIRNCEDVEDCLETSDIINNINTNIVNISQGGSVYGNPANLTTPIENGANYSHSSEPLTNPTTCGDSDKDALWGACESLIDFIHATNQDLFAAIAAYSNRAELIAATVSALPIVGLLPFDDELALAAKLADTVGIQYAGNTTTTGLYAVKCAIFCIAVDNGCQLDLEDVFQYLLGNDGIAGISTASNITEWAAAIAAASSLTGMQWFCEISAFQLGLSAMGETFVTPVPFLAYARSAQAGAYNPNGGWAAWCDACATHTGAYTLILDYANDFVASGSEIVYRNMYGKWTQVSGTASVLTNQYGKGIIYTNPGSQGVVKQVNISPAATCTKIRANVRKVSGTASTVGVLFTTDAYSGQARLNFSSSSFAWTAQQNLANVGGTPGAITRFRIDLNTSLASQTCVAEIRYIEITGTGALPKIT